MKLKFFPRVAEARTDEPSLTIRRMGRCQFNRPASDLLGLEAGEAATLALDEDSQQWLLLYFPDGAAQHCTVRFNKGSFGFQHRGATKAFFAKLPKELADAEAVRVPLLKVLPVADMPEAKFYQLETGLFVRNDRTVVAPNRKGGKRG